MLVVAGLVAGAAGCWVWAARPHQVPVSLSAPSGDLAGQRLRSGGSLTSPLARPTAATPAGSAVLSAVPTGSTGGSAGSVPVVVDVVGKVLHPGVYRLPAGSRVDDAVTAAGGVLHGVDPASVNLARKLTDGEQLAIGLAGASAAAGSAAAAGPAPRSGPGSGSGTGPGGGPLDLNAASASQLDALPGVGPVLAQRIVDWRTQHGRFDSVNQLNSVSGIGDAKFADLAPLVTVG